MLSGQDGSAVLGSWQVVAVPVGEPQPIAYYEEAPSPSKRSAPQSQYRDQILKQLAKSALAQKEANASPLSQGDTASDRAHSDADKGEVFSPSEALRSGTRLLPDRGRSAAVGLRWNTETRVWERV